MSEPISIRTAAATDVEALGLLFEAYRSFYKQEANFERAKDYLASRIQRKDAVIYVAESPPNSGKLLAFAQLYPLLDSLKLGNKWLLNDLYVDPAARGTGVGKKLLSQAKKLAVESDATGVLLSTQKTNKIGNSLYPSQGWKLDEEFNRYGWLCKEFDGTGPTGLVLGPNGKS